MSNLPIGPKALTSGAKLSDNEEAAINVEVLGQKAESGLKWGYALQAVRYGGQIGISIVLTRMLSPEAFGLVAMPMVLVNMLGAFADFGLTTAVAQRVDPSHRLLSSVFWVNLLLSALIACGLLATASLGSKLFDSAGVAPLIQAIAPLFMLQSARGFIMANLRRKLKFRQFAWIELVGLLFGGLVGIKLAMQGWGAYSILGQYYAQEVTMFVTSMFVDRWLPSFLFSWRDVRSAIAFASGYTGLTAANMLMRNADNLLIGRYFGEATLGIYVRAYAFVTLPISQVQRQVAIVMGPTLVRLVHDMAGFRRVAYNTTHGLLLAIVPPLMGLCVVADLFVTLIFGDKWVAMIPVMRWYLVLGIGHALVSNYHVIWLALGKTRTLAIQGGWMAAVAVVSFISGIWLGSLDVLAAINTISFWALVLLPSTYAVLRDIEFKWGLFRLRFFHLGITLIFFAPCIYLFRILLELLGFCGFQLLIFLFFIGSILFAFSIIIASPIIFNRILKYLRHT